jgi:AcrR family transcriptional regulator
MSSRRPTHARRHEIADAALRIIAERGLRRFTTAAVASEVELSEGAIFRHFPSKQAIVTAAIERVRELLFTTGPEEGTDPLERLGQFVRFRVLMVHAHPGIPRIVFSEELARAAGPAGARAVDELKRRSFAHIRDCLDEAAAKGLIRTDVPVDHLALLVQGLLLAMVFGAPKTLAQAPKDAAEAVWASVERMIRKE